MGDKAIPSKFPVPHSGTRTVNGGAMRHRTVEGREGRHLDWILFLWLIKCLNVSELLLFPLVVVSINPVLNLDALSQICAFLSSYTRYQTCKTYSSVILSQMLKLLLTSTN
jgi:hypothetical protein